MSEFTAGRFRILVEERFRFLERHGFRRSPAAEHDSPVGASVVYLAQHVGFVIACDIRDAQVDVRVGRVRLGSLAGVGAAGHPRDLLGYLVEHAGYRGGRSGAGAAEPDALARMVDWWAELLRTAGAALLADPPDAFPQG